MQLAACFSSCVTPSQTNKQYVLAQGVAEEAAGLDTAASASRVSVNMQDDELSPLIVRHVEESTRELRCQLQEVDARSRRMEALLNELVGRSSLRV